MKEGWFQLACASGLVRPSSALAESQQPRVKSLRSSYAGLYPRDIAPCRMTRVTLHTGLYSQRRRRQQTPPSPGGDYRGTSRIEKKAPPLGPP